MSVGETTDPGFASGVLRDPSEIAKRYCCHCAVFAWGSAPPQFETPIANFIQRNGLNTEFTADEAKIIGMPKEAASEEHAGSVGWRLENMWSLAWLLGMAPEPSAITGQLGEDVSGPLLDGFLPEFDVTIESLVSSATLQEVEEAIRVEDLFYLAHNAVRSAQIGSEGVPPGFDPIGDGGAIHERRHSLTWALAPETPWDETDLST
jgi:hypothetical protein